MMKLNDRANYSWKIDENQLQNQWDLVNNNEYKIY